MWGASDAWGAAPDAAGGGCGGSARAAGRLARAVSASDWARPRRYTRSPRLQSRPLPHRRSSHPLHSVKPVYLHPSFSI